MSIALLFWVLYLLAFVFSIYNSYPAYKPSIGLLLVYVLIGLLGWQVFGPAIHR